MASNLRVQSLHFLSNKSIYFSFFGAFCLTVLTILGLVTEYNQSCIIDLKGWLVALDAIVVIRCFTKLYVRNGGDAHSIAKVSELMDVFGVVWFSVGNFIVFADTGCVRYTPIVYITSFIYIVLAYLCFLVPTCLRCSLSCFPPTADIGNFADTVTRANSYSHEHLRNESSNMSEQQSSYWRRWLEEHNCFEMIFDQRSKSVEYIVGDGMNEASNSVPQTEDPTSQTGTESLTADRFVTTRISNGYCSICLLPFLEKENPKPASDIESLIDNQGINVCSNLGNSVENEKDICRLDANHDTRQDASDALCHVVRYACAGHHYFHTNCLHQWLHVATARVIRPPRRFATNEELRASIQEFLTSGDTSAPSPPTHVDDSMNSCITCPYCREAPIIVRNDDSFESSKYDDAVIEMSNGQINESNPSSHDKRMERYLT